MSDPRSSGSLKDWRRSLIQSDLDSTTKGVLLTLAVHLECEGFYGAGAKQLAEEAGYTPKTVRTKLNEAEQLGWISRHQPKPGVPSIVQASEAPEPNSGTPETSTGTPEANSGGAETSSGGDVSLQGQKKVSSKKSPNHSSGEHSASTREESSEPTNDDPLIESSEGTPDISEYFDGLDNREPLDSDEQVTLPKFNEGWKRVTGSDFGQQGDSGWHMAAGPEGRDLEKFRVVSTYFTKSEIREALREVKKADPDRPWPYFRKVLEESCRNEDASTSVIDRYKTDERDLTNDDDTSVVEKYGGVA
jgi:hypothetical protein